MMAHASEREGGGAAAARRARRLGRALLIYGLLAGGSAVFAFPFLWMIGASFKVDREMFGGRMRVLPIRPVPAVRSPYLDPRAFPAPDHPACARAAPALRRALAASDLGLPAGTGGSEAAAAILAPGAFDRLVRRLPAATWAQDGAALDRALAAAVTPELARDLARQALRRLTLGAVRVRSLDLQEVELVGAGPVSAFWTVEGHPSARLVDAEPEGKTATADLHYDFGAPGPGEIRLSRLVDLPFQAARLHRVQLGLRPDDGWHPVEFLIEKEGRLYRGRRPEYLGNFQWSVVTLQEYGPDDRGDSSKIRLWIPYREAGAGPAYDHGPARIKLTLVLRRNSAAGAWWAKCQRNYRGALDYVPFWRYAATSVFLVVLNVVGNVLACSLVAFSFARLQWPGRGAAFGLMLATLMIPPQITMIPYFLIIKHLGWYNTLKPLWLVSFFGNAFNIFLLRQFMKGIPRDLEDAARIDGCSSLQIYWYVIMPLVKPTLACIAIFTFMGVWNDFMGPLIYLSDQRLYPLSLGLYALSVQANLQLGANFGMMLAGSLLMTVPVILIFFFAQKYFIQGVTLTGMKS